MSVNSIFSSLHDQTVVQDGEHVDENDFDARSRQLTEKGLAYQVTLNEGKFRSCASQWRREYNAILIVLTDTQDVERIRHHRQTLQNYFNELFSVFEQLMRVKGTCNDESVKMENIEIEHQNVMTKIANTISKVEHFQNSEVGSVRSGSKASNISGKSRSSRISDAAAKTAVLRAELKYIEAEAQSKAALHKIQTLRKLDIAEAEMQALKADDEEIMREIDVKPNVSVPVFSNQELVQSFLQSHPSPQQNASEQFMVQLSEPNVSLTSSGIAAMPSIPGSVRLSESHANVSAPVYSGVSLPLNPIAMTFTPSVSNIRMQTTQLRKDVPADLPTSICDHVIDHGAETAKSNNADSAFNKSFGGDQGLLELTKSLVSQIGLSRLPSPEPSIFSGDPLSYPSWKASFEALIEQRQIPPAERIHYLKRYVAGPVREVIEGFFLLSSDEAYLKAKELLHSRYGDHFVIANAFRDKLENWPKISSRDGKGLRKFGDFLYQCCVAMQSFHSLSVLNDDRENQKLLKKLPDWIVTRWGRLVSHHKLEKGIFPSFERFAQFVSEEAKIACDPVTSLQSLHSVSETHKGQEYGKKVEKGPKGRSFLSGSSTSPVDKSDDSKSSKVVSCPLCNKEHELDICKGFLAKSIMERKAFIKDKGLCFACLGRNHISKKCRHRKKCQVCGRFHPSSLHGDVIQEGKQGQNNPEKQNTSHDKVQGGTVFLSDSCASSKCSMIVPVYVSHSDNPNNERLVYALLDTQSDTTFVLDDTCKGLGVTGVPVQLSLSTMHAENKVVKSSKIKGLSVRGINSDCKLPLPVAFSRNIMPANRTHIPTPDIAKLWPHLEVIADQLLPANNCEIGLLIGYNCPKALVPREVIPCTSNGPYGQRTDLGWGIVGVVDPTNCEDDQIGTSHRIVCREISDALASVSNTKESPVLFSLRTSVKEIIPGDVLHILESDFKDATITGPCSSHEDRRFLSILSEGIVFQDGHYEMPLPFRVKEPLLSDNKSVALNRLNSLKRRLLHDSTLCRHYTEFMQGLLNKGHAEKVPDSELSLSNGHVWYIPHHGVYHPQKPDKIRVVFDCSSSFKGVSLNSHLLQGPDLSNKLLGVLSRFRKEAIAFMCDVEKMFYQFRVIPEHRNYLRFLWWDSEDFDKLPVEYRMTVHLFGATSSPGCANFGFKRVADDHEPEFGLPAANFIRRDFYVDDGIKSVPNEQAAVQLIESSIKLCQRGGLRLHKFLCNSKVVLEHLDPQDCADNLKGVDLSHDSLPIGRVLGILWCVESDMFQFHLDLKVHPDTRRGVLSTVSSVYDPFGFLAPFVLKGKQILQQLCADQSDWDDRLPDHLLSKWETWRADLDGLTMLRIPRCVKPKDFGEIDVAELHHFSDASSSGYGQCTYLRLVNKVGQVHCSLLIGKARVVPLKPISIPRLELSAAVLSVKMGAFLENELEFDRLDQVYWTDSKVVIGYINNDARRFHIFVANRVQQIRNFSKPCQWRYVTSADNPADLASRGVTAQELISSEKWFKGPSFLWKHDTGVGKPSVVELDQNDPEVKDIKCFASQSKPVCYASLLDRIGYFSDWHRAKRAIAVCLRYKDKLRELVARQLKHVPSTKCIKEQILSNYCSVTVKELQGAENEIIKQVQSDAFAEEVRTLRKHNVFDVPSRHQKSDRRNVLKRESYLNKLDPFLDENGLLRVGGRIQMSDLSDIVKFPVLLPKRGHVTQLMVKHFHERVQHGGRGSTLGELRSSGIWIVGGSSVVSYFISRCVLCRKLRSQTQNQKMANLPFDRLEQSPPFTNCAVDFFGPFYIKEGRRELKRYGVLYTCLSCRAVHVETANSLDTSSFINSLRRFIAIRGPIRLLRSDRGTNFVGAERELREAVMELDEEQLRQFLLKKGCDLFEFKMNFPSSSHMAGVWERQIRSVRNVMSSLLLQHGSQLDDEGLRTFLYEAANIVNSRPLAVDNLNDPLSVAPLTPNHLLTMKSRVILPPPGQFQRVDMYCSRRWRRIQYLANEFWSRWRLEFLQTLQTRNKWKSPKRNLCLGDIVLLKEDNLFRNQWRMGRVTEAVTDSDGFVRKVKLELASFDLDAKGRRATSLTTLERPIHKLVLLLETEEFPVEEP